MQGAQRAKATRSLPDTRKYMSHNDKYKCELNAKNSVISTKRALNNKEK